MFFRSHAGSRSLRIWRRCLSGSQQPLLLTRQCAHQPTTTWERILYQTFVEAGLPEPAMRLELPVGKEPYLAQWYYDTLCSVRPQMERLHLPIESLGSLDTLVQRLQAEVAESKTVACWFASVGAWCRKA